jgi:hypothetical protein
MDQVPTEWVDSYVKLIDAALVKDILLVAASGDLI